MMPARPMTHFVVGQPGFTLAALQAFFNAMRGLGHAGEGGQRGLRWPVGEVKVDLDDLLPVAILIPDHHHRFLMAFLTLRGTRHHSPFGDIDHQWPFGTIAHVDGRPSILRQRRAPLIDALPGTRGTPAPPADAGGAVSRSRSNVLPGTASRYRSLRLSSRRRNQYGRPISSSPAIHACGSAVVSRIRGHAPEVLRGLALWEPRGLRPFFAPQG